MSAQETLDIRKYVEEYERNHPQRRREVPSAPRPSWWRKDPVNECVERCKYELYATAAAEAGSPDESLTPIQRVIHARYASLQDRCSQACTQLSL